MQEVKDFGALLRDIQASCVIEQSLMEGMTPPVDVEQHGAPSMKESEGEGNKKAKAKRKQGERGRRHKGDIDRGKGCKILSRQ